MATRDMLADYGEQHSKIKTSARPFNGVLPGTTLLRESGPWRTSLGAEYNAKPRRGENQAASSAYTVWNVYMSYRQKIASSQAIWFARVDNLTDALAYSATSILTTTVQDATSGRPKAPLPGRSFKLGLQLSF